MNAQIYPLVCLFTEWLLCQIVKNELSYNNFNRTLIDTKLPSHFYSIIIDVFNISISLGNRR